MRRIRPITATLLAVVSAVALASTTLAKGEDAVATLDAPLPGDAQPGSEVEIGWTLTITGDDGSVLPFDAEGVFVRLSRSSGDPLEVVARQDRTGHYVATVTVPTGGLGEVEIGLRGTACHADGRCERSDVIFTMADTSTEVGIGAKAVQPPAGDEATGAVPAQPRAPAGTSFLPLALVAFAAASAAAIVAAMVALRGRIRAVASRATRS